MGRAIAWALVAAGAYAAGRRQGLVDGEVRGVRTAAAIATIVDEFRKAKS